MFSSISLISLMFFCSCVLSFYSHHSALPLKSGSCHYRRPSRYYLWRLPEKLQSRAIASFRCRRQRVPCTPGCPAVTRHSSTTNHLKVTSRQGLPGREKCRRGSHTSTILPPFAITSWRHSLYTHAMQGIHRLPMLNKVKVWASTFPSPPPGATFYTHGMLGVLRLAVIHKPHINKYSDVFEAVSLASLPSLRSLLKLHYIHTPCNVF